MSARRINMLMMKSAHLHDEIEKEQKRPYPDRMRLLRLKKLRLSIKDKICHLFPRDLHSWEKAAMNPAHVYADKAYRKRA